MTDNPPATTRSTAITDNCTCYIVSGDLGAVVCSTMPGSRVPFVLDFHHRKPQDDGPALPCDVLDDGVCYPEAGCGATELRRAWFAAGRDDEVIWATLERYYPQMAQG